MKRITTLLLSLTLSYALPALSLESEEDLSLEDLLKIELPAKAAIGNRTGERSAFNASVPIDVITSAQLQSVGQIELARALEALVPGFNYPRPSITDGTDHVPPFTLRSLSPDQVLVLVNGKRIHQSSLLNINGTIGRGTSGVDLNTLPIAAIDRVEILRDGAAAQYGSDAIAGIINIVLKGYGYSNRASISYGQTHQGDGQTKQADVFYSKPLSQDGFINLTMEFRDRAATNRAGHDPENNNQISVKFGDTDSQDMALALNVEVPQGDALWYGHSYMDYRQSSAGAFFRKADDPRNVPSIYPNGFLPHIEPEIFDFSTTVGVKSFFDDGTQWNISATHGLNNFHFYVNNSLNSSYGDSSPTSFDSGATRYSQSILNIDLVKKFGRHSLSSGYEYRYEQYQIRAGETASYWLGPNSNNFAGAQGFPGFSNRNAIKDDRHSQAGYLNYKFHLTPSVTTDAAVRAEHSNDFGSSLNGKLAVRWLARDWLTLRSSGSNGFRAPSLSQTNYSATAMLRSNNEIKQFGVLNVNDATAKALGAEDLDAEKSSHFTFGLVLKLPYDLNMSLDYFATYIKDKISPTNEIYSSISGLSPDAIAILQANNIDSAMYFTNALDTSTKGIDFRLNFHHDFKHGGIYKLAAGYQYAETKITDVSAVPQVLGITAEQWILDDFSKTALELGQPKSSFKLWSKYSLNQYGWVLNINRYGRFYSLSDTGPKQFGARWVVDTEFNYLITSQLEMAIGASNLFNAMPEKWGQVSDPQTGTGKSIEYSQLAPFGYNGAAYYARLSLRF